MPSRKGYNGNGRNGVQIENDQIENVLPSLKSLSGTPNFPNDLFTIPLAFHV